ncbi:MAG: hypothetical protein QF441_00900 [Bacteriovoracaceae bacterium]|nr:hypothetical protein [Halobacteriovoraceae bacterium]MDP7319127.1 hypothetical protein [Bacteriovoracaceae bacterium]
METQLKAFYKTPQGIKFVTIFGYATKGVPSLEINGVGKLSKNIKEKIIYMTRIRKLNVPMRRFVICLDLNEVNMHDAHHLKWLEFPLLLSYWYLCNLIPIKKLDNCIAAGWLKTNGEIIQMGLPNSFLDAFKANFNPIEQKNLMLINLTYFQYVKTIDSSLLLEHIPKLKFRLDYMESSSAIPTNSFIA